MLKNKKTDKLAIDEILTTGEIAKICHVDPRTVKRWIDEGVLVAHELPVTGFSRVRVEDFLLFLKQHNIPVSAEFKHLLKRRILIVDDEVPMVESIRRILSYPDSELYELETAADGFEAGQKIASFKPDLVILDVLMPKLDGFGVCRRLRENPATRDIKVLIMSALITDEEKDKALSQGADDFIAKPFEDTEFKLRIERLLSRRSR